MIKKERDESSFINFNVNELAQKGLNITYALRETKQPSLLLTLKT